MQNWIAGHPILFVVLLFLAFALYWCLIVNLISLVSGWRVLARRFGLQQPFMGPTWNWQSARIRFARYNSCLTVGADPMGIFLRPMVLFRPGHPPLFIPWTEITVRSRSTMFGQYPQLMLGSSEQIAFTMNSTLASRLESAAASSWPGGMDTAGAGHGVIE